MLGHVNIKIIEGISLMAMDINGLSDPYVKIHVPKSVEDKKPGYKKEKPLTTSVQKETLNPQWNESFKLEIERVCDDLIILEVWDKDMIGNDDFLGFVTIDCSVLPLGEEVVTIENLSYAERGQLKIGITALDFGWVVEGKKQRYIDWRSNLQGSRPFYIEKEEERIKKMDQYSKNRDQGPYVSKSGCAKRLYKRYSVVNGWIKRNASNSQNIKENVKTVAIVTGAVLGGIFEESMKHNTCMRNHEFID
eukprot:gene6102-7603_t